MSSWILTRQISAVIVRSNKAETVLRLATRKNGKRSITAAAPSTGKQKWERSVAWILGGAFVTVVTVGSSSHLSTTGNTTSLDALGSIPLPLPLTMGPMIVADDPVVETSSNSSASTAGENKAGMIMIEEPVTGISFPPVFQSRRLLGLGVRKKYTFVNVYAVGWYVDQKDFKGLPEDEYEEALLNPHLPRTARIVMNRTLTMDKVISALIESVKPRMHGRDLFALENFSKLKSYGKHLKKGEEIILTIRGDSVVCTCTGGQTVVESEVFTRAICDVYFGAEAISPPAKASVMAGISAL